MKMVRHKTVTYDISEFVNMFTRFGQEKIIITCLVKNRFPVVAPVVNMINIAGYE